MANAYSQFVKEHIHQFAHLAPKDRMRECAKLYHEKNGTKPKPKKVVMKKKVVMEEKGGSILGDILPFGHLFGLGLDTKKKAKMPRKKKMGGDMVTPNMTASGGNFWDDFKSGIEMPLAMARHVLF